jgi:hypothetical protein
MAVQLVTTLVCHRVIYMPGMTRCVRIAVALTRILVERPNGFPTFSLSNEKENLMKLTTIALAIAFALPTTFAFAQGPMNPGSQAVSHYRGVTVGTAGSIATRPPNFSGNTLAPIMHDPSGSTLTPSAMSRGG